MAQLAPMMQLRARFEDKCGHPLAGGSVFAFEVGTSTPKDTFKDAEGTIPNSHPIKLDYRGEADIFLLTGRYRFVVYSCTGTKIYDVDDVGEWLGNISAVNVIDGDKDQHQINSEQALKNTELEEKITTEVEAEKLRATTAEAVIDAKVNANGVGNRAYKTYAAMDADKANIPAESKVTVTNDTTSSNNGDWQWDGVVFTKSAYDPVAQAKGYVDDSLKAEESENLYSDVNNHNGFNINPADMKVRTGVNTSVNVTELEFGKTYQLKTDQPIDKAYVIVGTHLTGTIDTTKVLNRLTLADTADPLIKTFTMPAVHKFVFINVWWASASIDIRDDLVLANAGAEVRKVVKKIQGNDVYDADAQQKIKDLQDTVVVDSDIVSKPNNMYSPEIEHAGFYVNRSSSVIATYTTSSLVIFPIEAGKTYLI
ncbi:hypothetical protein ACG9ZC_04290, partial [Acinetobacter baumannii]